MHEPVVDGLEEYLAGTLAGQRLAAFQHHVTVCGECRRLVAALPAQQAMFRGLRPPQPVGPKPGFYARVWARIEAERASSIWSVFLEPAFGRRLSYAALALLVVLSVAVWNGPGQPAIDETNPMVVFAIDLPDAPGVDPGHDRAVVLTHLVSMGENGDEAPSLPVSSD
ncbi:MAG: hypothetical protein N2036_06480 [Bryobacteraceae bacterium]|nr:hypothetical protein [Bryobacteraceae bacterium]